MRDETGKRLELDELATVLYPRSDGRRVSADEREGMKIWDLYNERAMFTRVLEKDPTATVIRDSLDELPDVDALDALAANARVVELLTGRRWYVMEAAREAGETWEDIGAALGMTKQGAQDWYRRKIEQREQHAGKFHDAARARAVLDEATGAGAERIRATYASLAGAPGEWVSLTALRAALPDVPRAELDAALLQLAQEAGVTLNPDPDPTTLTPEDLDSTLHMNGQGQHLIAIDDVPGVTPAGQP